jgi:hypothetical protein
VGRLAAAARRAWRIRWPARWSRRWCGPAAWARLREALRDQTLEGVRRVYGPPLDAWLDQLEERIAARVAALIAQRSLGSVAPD